VWTARSERQLRDAGFIELAEATAKQYDTMIELGLGELDKSGVAELTFASRRPHSLTMK